MQSIVVCKVSKDTGQIINKLSRSKIVLTSTDKLQLYRVGDSQGQPSNEITFEAYSTANYYYMIYLDDSSYGGSETSFFKDQLRVVQLISPLNPGDTGMNRKLANECDVLRLVSQNYSAIFEFSPAKSGGVDGFLADCTYKPWSPYIHILPKLKGLYGENFVAIDDARGLICGGDMSLPQLSNE